MTGRKLLAVLLSILCSAAAPATQPAATNLRATITEIRGLVQVRERSEEPWRQAEKGMELGAGAEFRTGPRSSVTLNIPPTQVITLDRLGVMSLLEAIRSERQLKTDLGMKYGRVRYHIEAAGIEHEAVIRSPSSSLSIRGTDVEKLDDPLFSDVRVFKGLVDHRTAIARTRMGTGPEDVYGNRPIEATADQPFAAAFAAEQASNPSAADLGVSTGERDLLRENTLTPGPVVVFWPAQQPEMPPTMGPGRLAFVLEWKDGGGGAKSDMNLWVRSPWGERLTHANPRTPSGGTMSPDSQGATAREWAVWERFPYGQYRYGVNTAAGGQPANFRVTVLRDGRPIARTESASSTLMGGSWSSSVDVAGGGWRPLKAATAAGVPGRAGDYTGKRANWTRMPK